jgi:hypothetical protein
MEKLCLRACASMCQYVLTCVGGYMNGCVCVCVCCVCVCVCVCVTERNREREREREKERNKNEINGKVIDGSDNIIGAA